LRWTEKSQEMNLSKHREMAEQSKESCRWQQVMDIKVFDIFLAKAGSRSGRSWKNSTKASAIAVDSQSTSTAQWLAWAG
jgi:hypothetical protein